MFSRREEGFSETQARSLSGGKKRDFAIRCAAFTGGVIINSFGIAFITKAALGTSPISSLPYVLSLYFPFSLGGFTFVMNILFIAAQFALLGREIKPVQLLQIVVNVVFSSAIDISMSLLNWLNPVGLAARLASLLGGCIILAFGVALEVAPGVLVVPGEGIVNALSRRTGVRFGTMKVIFDVSLMTTAAALSFVLFGRLNGLGAGTLISALIVGRIVNFFNRYFKPLSCLRRLRETAQAQDKSGYEAAA